MIGEPQQSAAGEVAGWVRSRILGGVLAPGDRIKQEEIAIECGTSRIPVRDALTQLNNEGLVVLAANSGARVAKLNAVELDEVYLLRECVEPRALAASIPNLGLAAVEELEELASEMERVADPADPAAWVQLDREFHLTSYSAAGLPEFLRLIESLWNRTQQYRRAYTRLPESFETAHLEHRLLLNAIRTPNPDDAAAISELHIRRTRLILKGNLGPLRIGG